MQVLALRAALDREAHAGPDRGVARVGRGVA
jgi:hypothetical protein